MNVYYTCIKEDNTIVSPLDWHAIIFEQAQFTPELTTTQNYIQTITHKKDVAQSKRNITTTERNALYKLWHALQVSGINPDEHYHHFEIPKTTGGVRPIDAPDETLRVLLKRIRIYFEYECRMLPHNAAFAYFKTRSIKNALEIHQKNESNWFAKLDMSNFFPSITTEVLYKQLLSLYPFYKFDDEMKTQLFDVCKFCTLRNRLPQGAETSPLLSNLIMVPFDYHMSAWAYQRHFRYTRYADDILISNKRAFNINQITQVVNNMLTGLQYPMQLNESKTRYGSRSGQNWNLGLMLNQQNNITLGHKKKECLRAALNNFLKDWTNGTVWSIISTQQLMGELNYFSMIEPEYAAKIFSKLENKYNVPSWRDIAKQIIKG